jgi:hypothetical protein
LFVFFFAIECNKYKNYIFVIKQSLTKLFISLLKI